MKKFLYGAIYFFILAMIFRGVFTGIAESVGFDIPTAETVFLSNDGGDNWQNPQVPGKTSNGQTIFFNTENTSEIFLASNNGIFQVKDQKTINKNDKLKKTLGATHISDFIQDPQNPNIFYLVSNKVEKSELFVSYDYGENFQLLFTTERSNKISVLKINPIDGRYLYIGTQGGLFLVSEDGGISWEKRKSFSPRPIQDIAINQLTGDIYISLSSKIVDLFSPEGAKQFEPNVYVSTNGGDSFSKINKFNDLQINRIEVDNVYGDVYFVSSQKIFVLRNNKITSLKLISQGKNNSIGAFTMDPKNSNILYVGIRDILYRTANKGNTWSIISVPISGKKIKEIKINQENSDVILLTVTN